MAGKVRMHVTCWRDQLQCRPPDSWTCGGPEDDSCYRDYRRMSAGCSRMHWTPEPPDDRTTDQLLYRMAPGDPGTAVVRRSGDA